MQNLKHQINKILSNAKHLDEICKKLSWSLKYFFRGRATVTKTNFGSKRGAMKSAGIWMSTAATVDVLGQH